MWTNKTLRNSEHAIESGGMEMVYSCYFRTLLLLPVQLLLLQLHPFRLQIQLFTCLTSCNLGFLSFWLFALSTLFNFDFWVFYFLSIWLKAFLTFLHLNLEHFDFFHFTFCPLDFLMFRLFVIDLLVFWLKGTAILAFDFLTFWLFIIFNSSFIIF